MRYHRDFFHYLDSIISKDEEIDEDVEHRIKNELIEMDTCFVTDELQQD